VNGVSTAEAIARGEGLNSTTIRMTAAGAAVLVALAALAWRQASVAPADADARTEEVELEAVSIEPPEPSTEFDGKNAHRYLVQLCKLGPRLTASRPMAKQQEILKTHFEKLGAEVALQTFEARQPSRPAPFRCTNLVVRWPSQAQKRVLLGCHYDTRPMADREPPLSRRRGSFVGANDSTSCVALLMELGRLLPNLETGVGVDFVFFDAEEFIYDAQRDAYFIGSEYFVGQLTKRQERYDAAVVLDMIAGKNLRIHPEVEASFKFPDLIREIWGVAAELGVREFDPKPKHHVRDDHEPFLKAGMNATVLIDFDYPHWHRLSDTPENCSAVSMEKVAKVLSEWLKRRR
jgi:hypothetical protein